MTDSTLLALRHWGEPCSVPGNLISACPGDFSLSAIASVDERDITRRTKTGVTMYVGPGEMLAYLPRQRGNEVYDSIVGFIRNEFKNGLTDQEKNDGVDVLKKLTKYEQEHMFRGAEFIRARSATCGSVDPWLSSMLCGDEIRGLVKAERAAPHGVTETRVCAGCGLDMLQSEYSKHEWDKGDTNSRCTRYLIESLSLFTRLVSRNNTRLCSIVLSRCTIDVESLQYCLKTTRLIKIDLVSLRKYVAHTSAEATSAIKSKAFLSDNDWEGIIKAIRVNELDPHTGNVRDVSVSNGLLHKAWRLKQLNLPFNNFLGRKAGEEIAKLLTWKGLAIQFESQSESELLQRRNSTGGFGSPHLTTATSGFSLPATSAEYTARAYHSKAAETAKLISLDLSESMLGNGGLLDIAVAINYWHAPETLDLESVHLHKDDINDAVKGERVVNDLSKAIELCLREKAATSSGKMVNLKLSQRFSTKEDRKTDGTNTAVKDLNDGDDEPELTKFSPKVQFKCQADPEMILHGAAWPSASDHRYIPSKCFTNAGSALSGASRHAPGTNGGNTAPSADVDGVHAKLKASLEEFLGDAVEAFYVVHHSVAQFDTDLSCIVLNGFDVSLLSFCHMFDFNVLFVVCLFFLRLHVD